MKKLMLMILSGIFASSASAGLIYSNDFSGGDTSGWNGGSIVSGAYKQQDTSSNVNFRLVDDAINDSFNISFDAIAIGSWDSSGSIEDWFITVDRIQGATNVRLFDGNLNRGTNSFDFMDVAAFQTDELRIRFRSNVTGSDELFAIDNVRVTSVSEPGTIALLGLGLMGLGYARRKAA